MEHLLIYYLIKNKNNYQKKKNRKDLFIICESQSHGLSHTFLIFYIFTLHIRYDVMKNKHFNFSRKNATFFFVVSFILLEHKYEKSFCSSRN